MAKGLNGSILVTDLAPKARPGLFGFFAKRFKVGDPDQGRVFVTKNDGLTYTLPLESVRTVTANVTLTAKDDGATIVLDSADPIVVTLPTGRAGMRFRVVVKQADNAHAISPQAADAIYAAGLTAVVDKDLINSTSGIGASATLVSDGANGWYAQVTGTWTKES